MKTWAKRGFLLSLLVAFGYLTLGFARDSGNTISQAGETEAMVSSASLNQVTLPEGISSIEGKMLYRMRSADRSAEFTPAQVSRRAYLRNQRAANQEPLLLLGTGLPNTLQVPGGGDIDTVYHANFDSADLFDEWTNVDLSDNDTGAYWFAFDLYPDFGMSLDYNSIIAPTPLGDFHESAGLGHAGPVPAGPHDYATEIYIGFPDESVDEVPYRVAEIYVDMWIENDDADDYMAVEIAESPKWHLADGEWAMTSNQYSVPGYGNEWREDLMTPVIDLTSATGTVTLSFDHTYDMESTYWDGGTIWAREDEDSAWTVLTPTGGYNSEGGLYAWYYHDIASGAGDGAYGTSENEISGFTGELHTAETVTVDLTSYVGGTVQVRWAFASDLYYSAEAGNAAETLGWFVDNIDISDDDGSIFSNDGTAEGEMVAVRLGPEEEGPWVELDRYGDVAGGGSLEKFVITNNIIGAPGDTLGLRLRAVYDDDDTDTGGDAAAHWGFEVSDIRVMTYTRLALDLAVTFADLGDSVLTKGGFIETGNAYDIIARAGNVGLTDYTIYNTHASVRDAFGNEVYHQFLYTYAPGQGDTLYAYPDYQDFNDTEVFYNFPDWTPAEEGDYTLIVNTDVFGGDDDATNDSLVHTFHVYTAQPAFVENFNAPDSLGSLFADGWTLTTVDNDTVLRVYDLFGEGDTELTWFTQFPAWVAGDSVNETITTPTIDLSSGTGYGLRLEHWFYAGGLPAGMFNIKATNDGGESWSTVKAVNGSAASSSRNGIFNIDISSVADGQAAFQLAFELIYEDTLAEIIPYGYLTVDDVTIYEGADLTAPAAPTGLAAESGDMEAELTWTAGGSDVIFYSVYTSRYDDADSAMLDQDVSASKNEAVVEGLENDSTWYFFVSATDYNGNESDLSASATTVPADITAPTAITDLLAVVEEDTVTLTWTAPKESAVDTNTTYDIRYSTALITDANFAAATAVPDSVIPVVATDEADEETEVYLAAPAAGSEYYFAIITTDEKENASALSNVASTDHTAPAKVTDLALTKTGLTASDTLTLTFTSPGDDDTVGTATAYDIRITYTDSLGNWDDAMSLDIDITPQVAGSVETIELAPEDYPVYANYDMTFAMVATDEAGNESEVSDHISNDPTTMSIAGTDVIPKAYSLSQNYPNPFNPVTRIEFALPEETDVVLSIYNMLGQEITRLVADRMPAGYHAVVWEATDHNGRPVPSGVYFYNLQAGNFSRSMKMILLK